MLWFFIVPAPLPVGAEKFSETGPSCHGSVGDQTPSCADITNGPKPATWTTIVSWETAGGWLISTVSVAVLNWSSFIPTWYTPGVVCPAGSGPKDDRVLPTKVIMSIHDHHTSVKIVSGVGVGVGVGVGFGVGDGWHTCGRRW